MHPLDVLQNHRDAARARLVLLRELLGEFCGDEAFKPELLHAVAPDGRTLARAELVEADRIVETTPDGIVQRHCRGIRYPYRRQFRLVKNRVNHAFFGTRRSHAAEQHREKVHARLDGVFSPARARFAFSENIAPLLEHFTATGAALLVLVPEFEQETIRRAAPQREIDDSSFVVRFVEDTLYTDRVALGQGLEGKILFEKGFRLILGSVAAVGEYIEEVAVIDIALPVPHEVPEKAQLLPEKPTVAHVVLESLHLGFLLFCLHISNFRTNTKPSGGSRIPRSSTAQYFT